MQAGCEPVLNRPLRNIVETIVSRDLSPQARQKIAADFARARLAEGLEQNRQATGRVVPFTQAVDGRIGAALESVNPDNGRIIFLFDVSPDRIFAFIAEQLVMHAPRLTGRYADSFRLFAGGREIEPTAELPKADRYTFLNTQPYARRLERGWSDQAPSPPGIFQAVAALAKQRYSDVARIRFSFVSLSEFGLAPGARGGRRAPKNEDVRTPAIIVSLG